MVTEISRQCSTSTFMFSFFKGHANIAFELNEGRKPEKNTNGDLPITDVTDEYVNVKVQSNDRATYVTFNCYILTFFTFCCVLFLNNKLGVCSI